MNWSEIAQNLNRVTGKSFTVNQTRSVSGGCINQGYAISSETDTYFVKLNHASQVAMFEAEALGLQQMLATDTIRVPQPICWGIAGNSCYLVLEWVDLGRGDNSTWEEMGRQLAKMHESPDLSIQGQAGFGWDMNNTIGSTPQINDWTADWAEFFAKHRLEYQFKLANRRGGNFPQQQALLAAVPDLLAHKPQPSLVHGDLWGGNAACTTTGEPVIFDPATYIGDREVDIAMTELFGGFPAAFYRGYNEVFPLEQSYEQRKTLYNLYHILNHYNLFGGSYSSQANRMIAQILGR
ncbi:fructosamine kinase family protein [Gloeocapsopsis dulcis]|uniref:Fructosamine kinase family protein n=1 Tax=Gloeocapsopsis dulcis AAB1 = 1H9 TaxID=1433147 RepID=A0A6N8FQ77_9CHRO|nr:fructosamine kinase family protein [Gloeocapsopsis dulcis]MUL35373.1 hypothetical protein [Gloeocapsopsis dulcis AAB1 = 1H9]WNN90425.1 fructosamine kinase family protein [Gloeocapsopsis dulcis]